MSIIDTIETAYEEQERNNAWANSPYYKLTLLTIDARGKVGEKICSNSIKTQADLIIDEDISDKNVKGENSHYDMIVNGKYIEIKTAYRDKNNAWQHETIYKNSNKCDAVIFLDFDYDGCYISCFKVCDLPLGCDSKFFPNKHATLRKNKDDGFKLDFSRRTFDNFNNEHSHYFSAEEANEENIGSFLREEIFNYVAID